MDENSEALFTGLRNDLQKLANFFDKEKEKMNDFPALKKGLESMEIFLDEAKSLNETILNSWQTYVGDELNSIQSKENPESMIFTDDINQLDSLLEYIQQLEKNNLTIFANLKIQINKILSTWSRKLEIDQSIFNTMNNSLVSINTTLNERDKTQKELIEITDRDTDTIEKKVRDVEALKQTSSLDIIEKGIEKLEQLFSGISFQIDSLPEMKTKLQNTLAFVKKVEDECGISLDELIQKIASIKEMMPQEEQTSEKPFPLDLDESGDTLTLNSDELPALFPENTFGKSSFIPIDSEEDVHPTGIQTPTDDVVPDRSTPIQHGPPPGNPPPGPPTNPKGKKMNAWYYVLIFGGSALLLIGITLIVFLVRKKKKGVVTNTKI